MQEAAGSDPPVPTHYLLYFEYCNSLLIQCVSIPGSQTGFSECAVPENIHTHPMEGQ